MHDLSFLVFLIIAAIAIILFAYKWYLCLFVILAALLSSLSSAVNKKHQYDYQIESSKIGVKQAIIRVFCLTVNMQKKEDVRVLWWLIDKYKRANSVIIKKLQALCTKIARNLLATNAISICSR